VLRDFHTLLRRHQLPVIRLHDLRHTAATLLLVQDVNAKLVAGMLGHSDTRLTQDTYQHVVPELQQTVADEMQTALRPA